MDRPDFEWYRSLFLNCMLKIEGWNPSVCCKLKWLELGTAEIRRRLLETVGAELKKSCGISFEVNERLLGIDGPVESVIIQTFHEFNTIYLMDRINKKIRAERDQAER